MAFITDILNTIKNARKGKDMRQAIHDGIEQCYKDATGHPESVAATVKKIGEVSANLLKETADRKAEVNTERKRIDNLIKELPTTAGEYQQSKLVSHGYNNTAVKCTTTSGNYTNVPTFTTDQGGPLSSLHTKKSNYQIAVNKSGLYLFELRIHVNSLVANKRVELVPFINNTRNAALASSYNTVGNFTLTTVAALPIWLSANDTVDFRIAPIDVAEVSLQLADVLVYAIDWEDKFKIPDYTGYTAETRDIRTGADGTVYGTAGEAVRKQIGNITEDIVDLSTREYINLLFSSDVVLINQVNGFPHSEYEPKQVKTVDMSVVNEKFCEFQIKLNAKANRKYLLLALVKIKSGVGKILVLFYDVGSSNSVYSIYKDKVQHNGKNIGSAVTFTEGTNEMIGMVATSSKDGAIICRLRLESEDMTLVAEYSEMCLVDITDIYENETILNEYVNMSYSERFDLKPKGISAETKNELEENLTESKEYTNAKIEAEGHKSNYLYGKKWWGVGDSITYGARSDIDQNGVRKTYATYIADRNGMDLKLDAISGRAMGVKENRTDSFCLDGYYNNCPFDYPDYITIFLGTNDTEEVGTIDSTDINTFSGGYNKVLDYLTATYPRAKIGIIPVYDLAEQRGQMTIALGEKWGVPVFNWDTHSFFYYRYQHNTVKERKQKEFMYFDGTRYEVHPIDAGYQFMSTMIESWMREL